ncbi:hypothetical protein JCM21900_002711 [Sporobolomyces salmonicolor]
MTTSPVGPSESSPPRAALQLFLRSFRTRRRTWILLLASLLAYSVYSHRSDEGAVEIAAEERRVELLGRRQIRWDRERDYEDLAGGTFPPLDELEDRDRLWPPDLERPMCTPRIYVYDLPPSLRLPQTTISQCRWSAYNSELLLHDLLVKRPVPDASPSHPHSTLHTSNPAEADFFFVPLFPACYLFDCWVKAGWITTERCDVDSSYIQPVMAHIQQTLPYWNVSGGADHLISHPMDFVDGYYTEASRSVMNASSYLVTVGDRRPSPYGKHFRFYRDIVIPSSTHLLNSYYVNPLDYLDDHGYPLVEPRGAADPRRKNQVAPTGVEIFHPSPKPQETSVWGRRPSFGLRKLGRALSSSPHGLDTTERTTVAIFRGGVGQPGEGERYSLSIRSLFFPSTGNVSAPPFSPHAHPGFSSLPDFDIAAWSENDDYARRLSRSKFGLAPPGYTLDTTRVYEYLAFGVVPVFVGTGPTAGQVLPFENDVDWSAFTISIPRERAHEVPRILRSVSDEEYERLRRKVWEVGRLVVLEGREGHVWKYIARQLCRMKGLGLGSGSEIANN